jgi:hypothetical protein
LKVRAFIRHPSEFPIELCAVAHSEQEPGGARDRLLDVSAGGLCCLSHCAYREGERVRVRIPVGEPGFSAEGTVAWCRPDQQRFRVGIAFSDAALAFSARMVEQVCHIERYHRHLLDQGREVSEETAAAEWISKYAKSFPR